jgi:TolB-like protein/class 3 adenylate cyclase
VERDTIERRLTAILSADVVGYSRLMADDGVATVRTVTAYREQVTVLVGESHGRVVDSPGDNVLAEFPSALDAARCAVEIQRVLAARNADVPSERRMEYRIGVHLGDVMVEGDRLYGDGINIAARLEAMADPGGICISGTVHEQVEGKLPVGFEDLGEQAVKNIPKPVRAYRVRTEARPAAKSAPRRSLRRPVLGIASVLLVAAAVLTWRVINPGLQTSPRPPGAIEALAVLPLDNLSGDPEQEFFTDGMTDALIADLSKIGSLRVISRTSVMRYKRTQKPLPEIARELNVDAVVEGSVLRAGDGVRITAQLIDARDDRHLWSESYQRDLRDVLALQSEVARAIAGEIRLKLTPLEERRLEPGQRVDLEAFEAYIKGTHLLMSLTPADHRSAVRYLERSVGADPDYAPAWAALARVYT